MVAVLSAHDLVDVDGEPDLPPGWRPCARCGLGIPSSHGDRCELFTWELLFEQPPGCAECGTALVADGRRPAHNRRFCGRACLLQSTYRRRAMARSCQGASAAARTQDTTPWRRR